MSLGGRAYRFDRRSSDRRSELGGRTRIGMWGTLQVADEDEGGMVGLAGSV